MTWEEKIVACQTLGDFSLRMRAPGDWYVEQDILIYTGHSLIGGCVVWAKTPEEAVEQHWRWLTELPPGHNVSSRMDDGVRRMYIWGGNGWGLIA